MPEDKNLKFLLQTTSGNKNVDPHARNLCDRARVRIIELENLENQLKDALDLSEFFSDELVEHWEKNNSNDKLAEFMGLTDEEYAMYINEQYKELASSLREGEKIDYRRKARLSD